MYELGSEFQLAAEKLEKERNISKDAFIGAICDAILIAFKKKAPKELDQDSIRVAFDAETCAVGIFAPLTVKEQVENPELEISLEEAKEFLSDIKEGEVVEVDVTPEDFTEYGRIAAQAARQIVKQRLNEEEKKLLQKEYESFKDKIMMAQVLRVEERADGKRDVIVDLGRIEGVLPPKEQIDGCDYKKGDRIRIYILDFQERNRRSSIIVSHAHEKLLVELFRLEVPEIEEGIVEIMGQARAAGRRSKIAIKSNSPDVDPVGACIGSKGARIQGIVNELYGEKIDIVPWSEDPIEFISYALSPTQIVEIALYDENRALIIVPEDQLSFAIGRGGQNVKLASKLTGWKLDIRSEREAGDINKINKAENN